MDSTNNTNQEDNSDNSSQPNINSISLEELVSQSMNELGYANILFLGRTGVGKSTLLNTLFQGNMAETGIGAPVTSHLVYHLKEGIPLGIIDTPGLEMKGYKELLEDLDREIDKRKKSSQPLDHIHLAYFCVMEDGARIEEGDKELVKLLHERDIPVIGVLTKCRADNGMKKALQEMIPELSGVVRIRALCEVLDDDYVLKQMGLEQLVDLSMQLIPEGQREAFASAQKASFEKKVTMARKVVMTNSIAAGGIGATPIPISDFLLIVPLQIKMLAKISKIFGMSVDKVYFNTLVSGSITGLGATFIGRSVAGNLLKMIPGIGVLAGGLINSSTATLLTSIFGLAYVKVMEGVYEKNEFDSVSTEELAHRFKEQVKKQNWEKTDREMDFIKKSLED